MDESLWIIVGLIGMAALFLIGSRWWRNRRAGKLADELLENIVKGKDSFRR